MTFLRVTMPDGSKWDCPASLVARHRAMHYAEGEEDGRMYRRAYDETVSSKDLMESWSKTIPEEVLRKWSKPANIEELPPIVCQKERTANL